MTALPPLTFGLVLLFWGWQSGHWLPAIAAALWLEWAVRTSLRWNLSHKSIERIVDLTSLVLLAIVLYRYADGPFAEALFTLLHWSPLLLLPLLSAQLLSARRGIEHRALYYSQRRRMDPAAKQEIDLRFVYLAACLLAAGQDAVEPMAYFPVLALLSAWLLWHHRSRPTRPVAWMLMLFLVIGLGYLGQLGLRQLQTQVEERAVNWLAQFFTGETDPYRARTALGDIGNLKLSDRILYRVETQAPLQEAILLRTASYDRYIDTTWFTNQRKFENDTRDINGNSWRWAEPKDPHSRSVRIAAYLEGKKTILPAPTGTWRIEDLPVLSLARHPLGAVKVGEGPGLVRYLAHFDLSSSTDSPPSEADLRVPRVERPALMELAKQLALYGMPPEKAMERIRDHFQHEFRYTLELPGRKFGETALSHFLRDLHRGHCEYFASASVLLLRQVGIPARYAVGYSVQERDNHPGGYLVRNSHAHAWALVWHHGRWWDLDTTPAIWFSAEEKNRPFWQPLSDLISDLYYRFALSRLEPDSRQQNPWLWGLLGVLFLLLAYRLRLGRAYRRQGQERQREKSRNPLTPMEKIEAVFGRAGFARSPGETYGQWQRRLLKEQEFAEASAELEQILALHYRLRYRSRAPSDDERLRLQKMANEWLQRWSPAVPNSPGAGFRGPGPSTTVLRA
jgi:transglutaminase-like putative cysteine protease